VSGAIQLGQGIDCCAGRACRVRLHLNLYFHATYQYFAIRLEAIYYFHCYGSAAVDRRRIEDDVIAPAAAAAAAKTVNTINSYRSARLLLRAVSVGSHCMIAVRSTYKPIVK